MADRYLLESGAPDGYLLEDGSGVLLLDTDLFPDVRVSTFIEESSAVTAHDVDMTGIVDGDRAFLMAILDNDAATVTLSGMPTGWTQIARHENTSGAGMTGEVWEKLDCDGTEASFQYSSSSAQRSLNRLFLIRNSHPTEPTDVSTVATGASGAPNPTAVTAGWGAGTNLFMAFYLAEVSRQNANVFPTDYDSNRYTSVDTEPTDTQTVAYGVATRDLNAASDNPGAFATTYTDRWAAYALAIRPAPPTVDALLLPRRQLTTVRM